MKRLLPKSLIGQIALVMAVALLAAQAINFTLIFSARQRVTLAQIEAPAISRFVLGAQRLAAAEPERRQDLIAELPRRGRFSVTDRSPVSPDAGDRRLEERLQESAAANGLVLRDVRAQRSDQIPVGHRQRRDMRDGTRRLQTLILSAQLADGSWVNGRLVTPRPDPWAALRLAGSTLLLYLVVLAAMIWFARRLARPLEDLTAAASRFEGRGEAPFVNPRGPADVQRAIEAFNAMSRRVGAMLDEKDRMLGAIGHDLRTPLASLRIRAESVEPVEESERMIATIEEMTAMLDDTLALARSGRAREPARNLDLAALVDTVVEELRALGHDVEMESAERRIACVRPNLLRRAVRNLVENAVKYGGGAARVSVGGADGGHLIEVSDSGPGIDESELQAVQEPFVRLEASRNRQTGGSGLGLALARAAAISHGGRLELANRPEGGLAARILLPHQAAAIP